MRCTAEGLPLEDIRKIVGTSPGRGIFDVVVTRHVLGQNSNAVRGILGQQICGGETGDTSPVDSRNQHTLVTCELAGK